MKNFIIKSAYDKFGNVHSKIGTDQGSCDYYALIVACNIIYVQCSNLAHLKNSSQHQPLRFTLKDWNCFDKCGINYTFMKIVYEILSVFNIAHLKLFALRAATSQQNQLGNVFSNIGSIRVCINRNSICNIFVQYSVFEEFLHCEQRLHHETNVEMYAQISEQFVCALIKIIYLALFLCNVAHLKHCSIRSGDCTTDELSDLCS